MKRRDGIVASLAVAISLLVLLVLALRAEHAANAPNPAMCERVMRQAYAAGTTLASRPPECEGVSEVELNEMVARILTSEVPGGSGDLTSY